MNFVLPFQINNLFDSLQFIHLAAILIGIGVTLMMDFYLSRLCGKGRITKRLYLRMRMLNKIGIFSALVLWSTLLVQMSHFSVENPVALTELDLWARIAIVSVLSLNLYLIRRFALPKAKRRIGLSIYGGLTDSQMNRMLGIGAVSSISWVTLLVLWISSMNLMPMHLSPGIGLTMGAFFGAIAVSLLFCKFGGKWARARFFSRLEQKKRRYRKITRTVARRKELITMFPENT